MTHKERVLRHLKTFGSITPWEAIQEYGNTRLSATIFTLKDDGIDINSEMVTGENRFGEPVRYAKYSLNEVNEEIE